MKKKYLSYDKCSRPHTSIPPPLHLKEHQLPLGLEGHQLPLDLQGHQLPLGLEGHQLPLDLEVHQLPLDLEGHQVPLILTELHCISLESLYILHKEPDILQLAQYQHHLPKILASQVHLGLEGLQLLVRQMEHQVLIIYSYPRTRSWQ